MVILKNVISGVPQPKITNKYDNVGCNFATDLRGPKFPFGFDLKDKNLTGYYGYSGVGYGLNGSPNDPFYWGLGPFYPITGVILDYPDPPYDYETLMQKEINADYMVNTIQNQLATQFMQEKTIKKNEELNKNINDELNEKTSDSINNKENFQSQTQKCNKNNIILIMAVVLIFYILLNLPTTETERNFNL
jgi:hypothetical protein